MCRTDSVQISVCASEYEFTGIEAYFNNIQKEVVLDFCSHECILNPNEYDEEDLNGWYIAQFDDFEVRCDRWIEDDFQSEEFWINSNEALFFAEFN